MAIPGSVGILITGAGGCVDWTPWGIFFICPFAGAVDSGRWHLIDSAVNPCHVLKCPLLTAFIQVALGGDNAHWCKNWRSCCLDVS